MPSSEEIKAKLVSVLAGNDFLDSNGELVPVDSMVMALISMQIETHWGVQFPLQVENFESVDRIVALIGSLLRPTGS